MSAAKVRTLCVLMSAGSATSVLHAQGASAPSVLERPQRPVPALLPPEIPASHEIGIGLQIRFEGLHGPNADSPQQRELIRQMCRARGIDYINDAPQGSHGRFQEWRVQLGARSYIWYEGQEVRVRADNPCHWELTPVRSLTVAVFDGNQTVLRRYDYNTRTLRSRTSHGDLTALGAEAPSGRYSGMSITDFPVVGRQVIATVPCIEYLVPAPQSGSGAGVLRCVTASNPVDGRRAPLDLKNRVGNVHAPMTSWQAVEILPRVEVNQLVFRGPPFFRVVPPPDGRRRTERATRVEE